MTFDQALQIIDQGKTPPVLFLHGEERFYQTEILNALIGKLTDADNRDFNLETFEAKTSRPAQWIEAAKTISFFGGVKLVIARNLHEISLTDAENENLLDYLKTPVREACLALTADSADRKRKLFKALAEHPGAVACVAGKEAELAVWLRKRARDRGFALGQDAVDTLLRRVGPRPGMLASALDKIIAYVGDVKEVTEKDVAEAVGEIRMENVFALTEALKSRNPQKALQALHNQMGQDEDPIMVLGTIAWQFRLIWEVKHHQDRRVPSARIAEAIGAKPFVVEKAMGYTRNFDVPHLKKAFALLGETDRELKSSGKKDPFLALESLVLKLCSGNF